VPKPLTQEPLKSVLKAVTGPAAMLALGALLPPAAAALKGLAGGPLRALRALLGLVDACVRPISRAVARA